MSLSSAHPQTRRSGLPGPLAPVLALGLAMLLGGCSFFSDAVWPSLVGGPPPEAQAEAEKQAADAARPAQPRREDVMTADAAEIASRLDAMALRLEALQTRLPLFEERLARTREALGVKAGELETEPVAFDPDDEEAFDRFMSEQITLTRLSEAVSDLELIENDLSVDIAKAAALKAGLASLAGSPALTRDAPARHAELSLGTEQLLLDQGRRAGELADTLQRWRAYLSAQSQQKGAKQPGRIRPIEPDQPESQPATPQTPQTPPTEDELRFAGRKALVSIRPGAIAEAESTLRPLLEQVQAQYPDVAFDLENRGAQPLAVDVVLAVLDDFGIETAVYERPLNEGEEPVIRLYPR